MQQVQTFIINLKERKDRRENVLKEFSNRKEFAVQVIEAVRHQFGAIGLWKTITHILSNLTDPDTDLILICQDDHQFTKDYSSHRLFATIAEARKKNADILCGGISWFNNSVQISNHLFWVEKFSGLQFAIIFKKFFQNILSVNFNDVGAADFKISELTANKFFIFPFISIQKDYGYSDVTSKNNLAGRVSKLFEECIGRVKALNTITHYYKETGSRALGINMDDYKNIVIPTYIIQSGEKTDQKMHVQEQFLHRNEFELTFTEAYKHKLSASGLWLSIRKIIQMAMKNGDDVIITCEDDHQFTQHYSRHEFIRTILETSMWNVEILIGGTDDASLAIPITKKLFWVGAFSSTQFLVFFKNVFQKIIDEPVDESLSVAERLSEIASNKMIFYPFISIQKEFDYSAISLADNSLMAPRLNEKKFEAAAEKLKMISDIKNGLGK